MNNIAYFTNLTENRGDYFNLITLNQLLKFAKRNNINHHMKDFTSVYVRSKSVDWCSISH